MDNQHRKITGYRELSQDDIDLMNRLKGEGVALGEIIDLVLSHVAAQRHAVQRTATAFQGPEQKRLDEAQPERWIAIARTHFQEGLMALTRAVAQPGFF